MFTERQFVNKSVPAVMASVLLLGVTGIGSSNAVAGPWPQFTAIGTAGVMCTTIPQSSTPRWSETALGRILVFDDAKDGKELCYVSLRGAADAVFIELTGADGVVDAGSGFIPVDVTPTYNTSPTTTTILPPPEPPAPALALTSTAFAQNGTIPVQYTCDANQASGFFGAYGTGAFPPLSWSNVPEGTQSFAVVVDDVSASFVHGVFYNIPAATTALPDNWVASGSPPAPAASIGVNNFMHPSSSFIVDNRYGGPCPPGDIHTYEYRLYALSETLVFPTPPDKQALETAMQGKILGQATLVGRYGPRIVNPPL